MLEKLLYSETVMNYAAFCVFEGEYPVRNTVRGNTAVFYGIMTATILLFKINVSRSLIKLD